jgi:multicomponent Na+:H+ antiporter subunit D
MNTLNLLVLSGLMLPFLLGFISYLLPRFDRFFAVFSSVVSGILAMLMILGSAPITLRLLDHFGVSLVLDSLAGFFVLTNALVTLSVIFYVWNRNLSAFFYSQVLILHGSVNAAFACSDFISLYVALEVISIATFLLITYPRTDRSLWVGLRYLFISNVAMLFYLVGAVLVYTTHHSFDFSGLRGSPPEAIALIFLGLLVKGGVFISGLWLPLTHSESETPVSALMSGIVVKAGIFPLVRCALVLEEIDPLVRTFGVATAVLGVGYAVFEKDTKRMLAFHTVSQLGFILAAPEVGGFYALTHGLVKAALFMIVGALPSRDLKFLQSQSLERSLWIALAIASFSISGFPLLSGFGAKILTMKNLQYWQVISMNLAAIGTSISFAKFIFLPHQQETTKSSTLPPNFWVAIGLLLGGLVVANVVYYEAYTLTNLIKPLATIALGWGLYWLVFRRLAVKLPRISEQFDHLVGVMSLTLVLIFWMARA